MRKDITTNILVDGSEKINKSALARQYENFMYRRI